MLNAYIGLGSNLENPLAQIKQAFKELSTLKKTMLAARSRLYRSKAIGPGEQPDYINATALLHTELSPVELLDALQAIEQSHRRVRIEHWGPRTLDLDILLLDHHIIKSERLTIPHPYLKKRNFVLYPLADIAPDLVLPCGTSLNELMANCPRDGLELVE